ncbi:MAG: RsmB/NOP family class I SAM-dependent RNA methyltransferase [bacterium]|nr:RsmB/NOP family class I SAM-dependent RNA methyltransferase [bacterium]
MDQLFLDRLYKIVGNSYDSVLASFSVDKLPSFRINTLVVSESEGIQRLSDLDFELEKIVGLDNAYLLKNKSKREFTDLQEYINGWYYLQSLSSMVPVSCIAQEITGKDRIIALDMCAAPGSKTSQLAGLLSNQGHIDAHDLSRQRIYQMKAVLAQLHVRNVDIHQSDASGIWRKYGPVFDIVLLDSVCSGEGRFRINDPKTFADWDLKKIKKMSEIQKRLMFSAIMCLKPGGVLIYSTCTIAPEENEAIIDFALSKFEGAIELEELPLHSDSFISGLTEWEGQVFDERLRKSVRILGTETWDGFYVCKIRRN